MNLSEYLSQQMREKNLKAIDIERRSKKKVTDSTIAAILSGEAVNPTLRIILGLAEALEVDPNEVFKAASEQEIEKAKVFAWTPHTLLDANEKLIDNPDLTRLFKFLLEQKPTKIKSILKQLGVENS